MGLKKLFQRIINWELWNFYLLYAPIAPVWLWYCLKSKAFWFFSSSNPTITFGGFEGEGKREMYEQLPDHLYPATAYIEPGMSFEEVLQMVEETKISYPFIVKPDVGMKGILFQQIKDEAALKAYHTKMPVVYLVQAMIKYPVEVSVFYYRFPWEEKGVISGCIEKELLHVVGDGKRTLLQLVKNHPRAKYRLDEMELKHYQKMGDIIEDNEIFYLSYAGNHNRGARFIDMSSFIDDAMRNVFDDLSKSTQFYYGRYDIKAASINDLKQGKNFEIIEFNGCGAEPNHIYDTGKTLLQAYKILLHHWKVLYKISRYNHLHGNPYWSYKEGRNFLDISNKHFKLLESIDKQL